MVKQAKQLLYLLISRSSLFFGLGCVFVLVFEGGCINSVPTSPLSPTPLRCSPSGRPICMHSYIHTHSFTHTLPPIASSVCVCRHQMLELISAPTPFFSYFLYPSFPASCLLFIHLVHLCTAMPSCLIQNCPPFTLNYLMSKMQFGLFLPLGSYIVFSCLCVSLLSHLTDFYLYSVSVWTRHSAPSQRTTQQAACISPASHCSMIPCFIKT